MDTITLQIKRVTGNWGTHKDYIPANGEPVMIEAGVISNNSTLRIVVGDGERSLHDLLFGTDFKSHQIASKKDIESLNPSKAPYPIGNSDRMGKAENKFALEDHSHKLYREVAENILETNSKLDTNEFNITTDFRCRRVMAGKLDPTADGVDVGGTIGDIYIRT